MRSSTWRRLFWLMLFVAGSLMIILVWQSTNSANEQLLNLDDDLPTNSRKQRREHKGRVLDICSEPLAKQERMYELLSSIQRLQPPPPKEEASQSSGKYRKKLIQQINYIKANYSKTWVKQTNRLKEIKSKLRTHCNAAERLIISQETTPVGTEIYFEVERKVTKVKQKHFDAFVKTSPLSNQTFGTCAVVGSGGILADSNCGESIDSADFVFRCNMPPVTAEFRKHVGTKTHLVTANPSILVHRYGSLLEDRRLFMEKLCQYGDAMMVISGFSLGIFTDLCLRTLYTIEDFESPIQLMFSNPGFTRNLTAFWKTQDLVERRLSTGFSVASLALELCDEVHLYGFWPYELHPYNFKKLTEHYYDNRKPKVDFHVMSDEFRILLNMHRDGVLKLHLGECSPGKI